MTSQAYCDAVTAIHELEFRVSQFGRSLRRREELLKRADEHLVEMDRWLKERARKQC